ncbi:MAG: hypothetical protein IKQ81_03465 [Clostridiales bacterium]|nr:hypothetical protein [Clostridiales bacterium]
MKRRLILTKIQEFFVVNAEKVLAFLDRHPWIVPSATMAGLSLFALNELGNHDAMEHGYDRSFSVGKLETGVRKSGSGDSTHLDADGGQPLIE